MRQQENNQIESWNKQNRNKEGDIAIDIDMGEIQRISRSYLENLYSTKLENLKEMDNFLDK